MQSFREELAKLDPKLFYLLLAGTTWLLIYLWRRLNLHSWNEVTKARPALQSLPALLLAGLLGAAPKEHRGMLNTLINIVFDIAIGGGGAILAHHALKAAPVPYNGGKDKPVVRTNLAVPGRSDTEPDLPATPEPDDLTPLPPK